MSIWLKSKVMSLFYSYLFFWADFFYRLLVSTALYFLFMNDLYESKYYLIKGDCVPLALKCGYAISTFFGSLAFLILLAPLKSIFG